MRKRPLMLATLAALIAAAAILLAFHFKKSDTCEFKPENSNISCSF